jgi:hypothetical protein
MSAFREFCAGGKSEEEPELCKAEAAAFPDAADAVGDVMNGTKAGASAVWF